MLLCVLLFCLVVAAISRFRTRQYPANTVGFLHASSGAGGGGERVLWTALDALQKSDILKGVQREYVVFTNPYPNTLQNRVERDKALLDIVFSQFHIRLLRPVRFVYLRRGFTDWLSGDQYRCLTLLLQTVFGGFLLYVEAALLNSMTPIVIETVGVPMVYPLLRVVTGSTTVSYTHYPIISSIMTERVRLGQQSTTNAGVTVTNPLLRILKFCYYQCFTVFYRLLGQFPHVIFGNSSWTMGHIDSLFWPRPCTLLYPPCDVQQLSGDMRAARGRNDNIVSVGQFRPEKNHMLQIQAFERALPRLPAASKLVMIGGARNAADLQRVAALKEEVSRRGIESRIEFRVGVSFDEIKMQLGTCCIGLHTMVDEHFGIVLLEYLAAGCVVLGNNSGGVKLDIIKNKDVGYLASTEEEYANAMVEICKLRRETPDAYDAIQREGRRHVTSFGDEKFGELFMEHLHTLLYR